MINGNKCTTLGGGIEDEKMDMGARGLPEFFVRYIKIAIVT
jgi:hypothetical protein